MKFRIREQDLTRSHARILLRRRQKYSNVLDAKKVSYQETKFDKRPCQDLAPEAPEWHWCSKCLKWGKRLPAHYPLLGHYLYRKPIPRCSSSGGRRGGGGIFCCILETHTCWCCCLLLKLQGAAIYILTQFISYKEGSSHCSAVKWHYCSTIMLILIRQNISQQI